MIESGTKYANPLSLYPPQTAKDLAPVPFVLKQQPKTLRELLTQLTELLVNKYNQRKEQGIKGILNWISMT